MLLWAIRSWNTRSCTHMSECVQVLHAPELAMPKRAAKPLRATPPQNMLQRLGTRLRGSAMLGVLRRALI